MSGMFIYIINPKDAKRIMAKLFKVSSFFFYSYTQAIFPLRQSSEIGVGLGEDNSFYIQGAGRGFPSGGFSRQIGKVAEAEHSHERYGHERWS